MAPPFIDGVSIENHPFVGSPMAMETGGQEPIGSIPNLGVPALLVKAPWNFWPLEWLALRILKDWMWGFP